MAATLPETQTALIQFANSHLAPFGNNAAAIGIDQADVTLLSTLITESDASINLVNSQRNSFRAAVSAKNAKLSELETQLRTMIATIKAFAKGSGDAQNVYDLAQIPAPNAPSPRPAPNTPTDLTAQMTPAGTVEVKFVADFAADVSFVTVQRVVNNATPSATDWTIVGAAHGRTFVDETVPAGSDTITYRVQAQRGSLTSGWSQSVNVALFSGQGPTSSSMNIAA